MRKHLKPAWLSMISVCLFACEKQTYEFPEPLPGQPTQILNEQNNTQQADDIELGENVEKINYKFATVYKDVLLYNFLDNWQEERSAFSISYGKKYSYHEVYDVDADLEAAIGKNIDFVLKKGALFYQGAILISPDHYLSPPWYPVSVRSDNYFHLTDLNSSDLFDLVHFGTVDLNEVYEESASYPHPKGNDKVAYDVEVGQIIILKRQISNKGLTESPYVLIQVTGNYINELKMNVIVPRISFIKSGFAALEN